MSVNVQAAFNYALNINARDMVLYDTENDTDHNVRASLANYVRNLAAFDDMVIEGREFVISKTDLDKIPLTPKRGMKITDADMGTYTISQVIELVGMGNIIGYRLRTN